MAKTKKGKKPLAEPVLDRFKVEAVRLEGARLLRTVGPTHLLWTVSSLENASAMQMRELEDGAWRGAIVRLQPPATATDEQVGRLAGWLRGAGVAVVRADQRARADEVQAGEQEPVARRSHREVVMARAEKHPMREELVPLLDGLLAGAKA